MFRIEADNLDWLGCPRDKRKDLCLHGRAVAYIGDKKLEYNLTTVSATALYLLKSLTEDHIAHEDNQMLPCCGFSLFADNKLENVTICGCANGIDWSVIHEGEDVRLILDDGYETIVSIGEYKKEVLRFVDKIEKFYQSSPPRKLPKNKHDREGCLAFWKEWRRRKAECIMMK